MQPDIFIDAQDRLIIRSKPQLELTLSSLPQRPWIAAYWVKEATGVSYSTIGRLRDLGVLSYRFQTGPKGAKRYYYNRKSVTDWIESSYVEGQY